MPNLSGMWTSRQQLQALGVGVWPTVPGAPTIGTATNFGATSISVAFTAPANAGYPAVITGYIVTSNPGGITATGTSSPILVTGLTTGTPYTFTVRATNASGTGPASAASNSVAPADIVGQQAYTTAGTYSWVAPTGVSSVSAVVVGGGGGGDSTGSLSRGAGGGALAYKNNVSVTPGSSYTVVVGSGGLGAFWNSRSSADSTNGGLSSVFGVSAGGGIKGASGAAGGTATGGDANRSGGEGGPSPAGQTGGGGAAGYSGNGGAGGTSAGNGVSGSGGGGGGGGSGNPWGAGGQGGGVGILGEGSNGTGGSSGTSAGGGGGGSGGQAGSNGNVASSAGLYGGGGAGAGGGVTVGTLNNGPHMGAGGAVRIIWPGTTRSFPSTNTGNL